MNYIIYIFLLLALVIGATFALKYFVLSFSNKKRSDSMIFLKIGIPKKDSKEDRDRDSEAFGTGADFKEVVSVMSQFYDSMYSTYSSDFKYKFIGQDFFSLEYVVKNNQIFFYIVCPRSMVKTIEKKITAFYSDVFLEEVPDYNLFNENSKVAGTYIYSSMDSSYPVRNYKYLNIDPINDITNSLSKLEPADGAAIQIMLRPAKSKWQKKGRELAQSLLNDKKKDSQWWNPINWMGTLFEIIVKGGEQIGQDSPATGADRMTQLKEEEIKAIDEKNTKIGYETIIRVLVSSESKTRATESLSNVIGSFSQFSYTDGNGFSKTKYHSMDDLVKNFIDRSFKQPLQLHYKNNMVLSSEELASIFHVPNIKYNRTPNIAWQNFKIAPPPENIPKEGILLGHNTYRGVTTEIRVKNEDRFRHFYVIGQTGTGKSSIFQSMLRQDFRNGAGVCVIDPHGSLVDDLLPHIPKERADDVIYFNPADLERPMGLNLLEATTDAEKDMVASDAMNIMIKMFDEEIFGPRIQDYFRNGCLTLMDDPDGGSLTDIVRLFTDDAFQKIKVDNVKNPIVRSFWENQMANTGQREKQEMIPYFAAKFGAFITNTMMRNIIGQTKSAFNFTDVMNDGKILLMNLSKGMTGDLNSKLLGLIIVSKIQMAALRRQQQAKEDRRDFFLYIDEFQNYITDSIESILSEARKYRLSLNLAHQYINQLVDGNDESIKNAVFGNVGSMMCYKISATDAEFMSKEMAPVFSDQDLVNVDKFKAVMKLSIDTQPSSPFSIVPLNPYTEVGDPDVGEAYKQLSRLKYGRDVEFVNREILRRIGV
jgi:hypothetical protein